VQYGYSEMASGANHSRLVSLTYPNGRAIDYNYGSGLDDSLSRLTSITDGSTTLEEYTYLGLGTVVKRAHPEPGVDLSYIKRSGESNGDAGDKYIGLDRFGRVADQRWLDPSSGTATDRFQLGYDRDSNVLFKKNVVDAAFSELYHANGASNGYDLLNQLTDFSRGTLSDTNSDGVPDTVSSPSHSQSWVLDALGNFASVTTDSTTVSRTHNEQNQVTGVGSATPTFDGNGNLTTDENGNQFKYDAWNRLVQVKDASNNVLASYQYDALGRRIVESVGSTTTDLYYSDKWQVLEERVGGHAKAQYVWSPVYVDALILRDRDADNDSSHTLEERLYAQQDQNYNVTALIDTSGAVVQRFVYGPYGDVTILDVNWSTASNAYDWRYLHQGGRYEWVTGLYHERARDRTPTLGRWLQNDPAGDVNGLNLYVMEGNQPTGRTDPSGQNWTIVVESGCVWVRTDDGTTSNLGRDLGNGRAAIHDNYGGGVLSIDTLSTVASRYDFPRVTYSSRIILLDEARRLDRAQAAAFQGTQSSMAQFPRAFDPNVNGHQAGQQAIDLGWSMVRDAAIGGGTALGLGLIRFGANSNQYLHATRHVTAAGHDVARVEAAIRADIVANAATIRAGLNVGRVTVDGQEFIYHAFQLADGVINVGRITLP